MNERQREAEASKIDIPRLLDSPRLNAITNEARLVAQTGMAAITIILEDQAYLISTAGFPSGIYRRATSLCGHAILGDSRVYVIPDTLADDRFEGNPYVTVDNGIRFYAAVQLNNDEQLTVGTLCVFDQGARDGLDVDQRESLTLLTDLVVTELFAGSEATPTPTL